MVESEESPIGKYGAAVVECRVCGLKHAMAYPIPIQMPCECPYCDNMACYFIEEGTDNDYN